MSEQFFTNQFPGISQEKSKRRNKFMRHKENKLRIKRLNQNPSRS